MDKSKKLIFFLLCLSNIAISFNIAAVAAAIPTISLDLNLPEFVVAKVIPFYMIPYGLGALLYAPLTRFFTYRATLIGIMFIYALVNFICASLHSLNIMLVTQMVAGMFAAGVTPLSLMIIGDLFSKDTRGRMVGVYFGSSFFAAVVGMVFMGLYPWPWLFWIPAMLGALTVICLLIFNTHLIQRSHEESFDYIAALQKGRIRDVFLLIFCMSFLYHAVQKWYGVYLYREYSLDKGMISFALILAAFCGLLGQQIGGYLSDKKGRLDSCLIGMFILSISIILLINHYSLYILLIILGTIGIGWTISHNAISTILTDFPEEDRPVIASLNSAVRFFSGGLGFTISKFFVEKSFALTYLGIGILFFLLIFYLKRIIVRYF